jgi:hypothetical protein
VLWNESFRYWKSYASMTVQIDSHCNEWHESGLQKSNLRIIIRAILIEFLCKEYCYTCKWNASMRF